MAHWLQLEGEEMSGRFKGVAVASLVTVLAFCVSGCLDGCSSSQEVNSGLNAQEQAAKSDEVASSDASEDVEVSQDTSELNGADELVGIWDDGYNEVMFDGKLAYLGDGEISSLYTVRAVEGNSITLSFDESGGELSFEFDGPDTLIGENGSDKPAKRISDNPYDEMPRRIILPLGEDYSGDDMAVSLESVEWKESFEIRSRKHDYALNSEDDVPGESYLLVQGEMESRFPSSVHLGSDAYAAILINNKYFIRASISNGEAAFIEPLSKENLAIYCSLSEEAKASIESAVLYLSFADAGEMGQLFVTPLI